MPDLLRFSARLSRTTAGAVLAVLAAVACSPPGPAPQARPAEVAAVRAAEGYMAPPELIGADRRGGATTLRGRATPGAKISLVSPDGSAAAAIADASGAWSVRLPSPQASPAMYALAAQVGARVLRAEGAVLLAPSPGPPVLVVRAGYAALALGPSEPSPRVVALDYDAGGAAAVAGFTAPRAEVRLSLDGRPAGIDQADANGRFAVLAASAPLNPGPRCLQVEANGSRAEVVAVVSPPGPLQGPFRAVREAGAWRVDWAPAGGGVQTTLVFDQPVDKAP